MNIKQHQATGKYQTSKTQTTSSTRDIPTQNQISQTQTPANMQNTNPEVKHKVNQQT